MEASGRQGKYRTCAPDLVFCVNCLPSVYSLNVNQCVTHALDSNFDRENIIYALTTCCCQLVMARLLTAT